MNDLTILNIPVKNKKTMLGKTKPIKKTYSTYISDHFAPSPFKSVIRQQTPLQNIKNNIKTQAYSITIPLIFEQLDFDNIVYELLKYENNLSGGVDCEKYNLSDDNFEKIINKVVTENQ